MYTVYILRTNKNTLYIGQTQNLEKRLQQHFSRNSTSAKYLRLFKSFHLVYTENFATRSEAMRREIELKSWPKPKKEALINARLEE